MRASKLRRIVREEITSALAADSRGARRIRGYLDEINLRSYPSEADPVRLGKETGRRTSVHGTYSAYLRCRNIPGGPCTACSIAKLLREHRRDS